MPKCNEPCNSLNTLPNFRSVCCLKEVGHTGVHSFVSKDVYPDSRIMTEVAWNHQTLAVKHFSLMAI